MRNPSIHISIAFNDAILPVILCDDGHERVPLQPIAKVIGLNWQAQSRKLQPGTFRWKQLGLEKLSLKAEQKEVIAIRRDKVTAFLHSLNPDMVRSQGQNTDTADWLEKKIMEWDKVIADYESGISYSKQSSINELDKLYTMRQKTNNANEKAALTLMIAEQMRQMGYPVDSDTGNQPDLPLAV